MVPHILVLRVNSLPALKQLQLISSNTFSCITIVETVDLLESP